MRSTISFAAAVALVICVTAGLQGQTVIPIDDFQDGNDQGWTHIDTTVDQPWGPGIFNAESGAYVLQGRAPSPPENPTDGALFSKWDMSADPKFSDGFVRFKLQVNEKNSSALLLMRGELPSDLSNFSGHVFGVNTELENFRFLIQTNVNFATVQSRIEDGPVYSPGQEWMMEAGARGDNLSLKYWKAGDPEPLEPQLRVTEGSLSTGRIMVGTSFPGDHNPASLVSATFDDLFFIIPEPASVALFLVGLVGVIAFRR